ncbi:MAG: hypothetical protein K8R88_02885 [Armatimonadetes bacterium]|nr:hypothetical protein [Armatimonadota bacterium]
MIVPTDLRGAPTRVTHEGLGLTGFSLVSQDFDLLIGHDRPGNRLVTSVRQRASWKVPDNYDFAGTFSPTSLLFLTTNGPRIVCASKGQVSARALTSAELKDQRVKVDLWFNKGFSMVDSTSDRWLLMKPGSPALILGPTKQVRIPFDQRPAPPNSVSIVSGRDAICYTRFGLEKGGTRIYLNTYNSKGLRKSASWFLEGMTSPVVYSLVLPD